MGEKISVAEELPVTQIPPSEFAADYGLASMRAQLERYGVMSFLCTLWR